MCVSCVVCGVVRGGKTQAGRRPAGKTLVGGRKVAGQEVGPIARAVHATQCTIGRCAALTWTVLRRRRVYRFS